MILGGVEWGGNLMLKDVFELYVPHFHDLWE